MCSRHEVFFQKYDTQKYTASITGQFGVSIGSIEASVGFDHGEEFTVSASTTSASLSAGETVEVNE